MSEEKNNQTLSDSEQSELSKAAYDLCSMEVTCLE